MGHGDRTSGRRRPSLVPAAMTTPILIFDSGVGGLSVLAPIRALLPDLAVVYAADNAGFPYGTKTEAEIAGRVPALLGRLVERYRPALVVIACNTASTIALAAVRAALDVPVVGTVPAIRPAAAVSVTRVIGVLGTTATVRQPYVDRLAAEFAADCTIIRHGSARLVELAEAKLRGVGTDAADYARELAGLLDRPGGDGIDTVVLACTHFPLVAAELAAAARELAGEDARELAGEDARELAMTKTRRPLKFVDGGEGIARRVAYLLSNTASDPCSPPAPGRAVFTPASYRDAMTPSSRAFSESASSRAFSESASSRAVFTRRDADVDALAPALHSFGLATTDYL